MANHEQMKDQLVGLVLGELSEPQIFEVRAHAGQCDECRTELRRLERLLELAGQRKDLSARETLCDAAREGLSVAVNRETEFKTVARPIPRWAFIGRMIMRSSATKIAVAAAIILAGAGGLFLWTGTKSGVALADVLAKVEQIQAFRYKMMLHTKGAIAAQPTSEVDMTGTLLFANDYGAKMDISMTDPTTGRPMNQQMYLLPRQKTLLTILPEMKKYMRMELDDSMFEQIKKQNNDPRLMIKQVLESQYKELGKSVIDAVEVEGFQTTDPAYAKGQAEEVDVKLWVDVKTWLPVRIDMKMRVNEQMAVQGTLQDFQWDVPVEAAQFNPVLPADFTAAPGNGLKVPAQSEQTALAGLRLCADLFGKYPENLNVATLVPMLQELQDPAKSQTPAAQKLRRTMEQARTDEERTQAMTTMMPLYTLGTFYMSLAQEKKDPAYYGKIVKPGDAAQVLLRWKTADNEYRVIFGDLHAITVNADTLMKLEAALPK